MNHEAFHNLLLEYNAFVAGGYVRSWMRYGEPVEHGYSDLDVFMVEVEKQPEFSARVKKLGIPFLVDFTYFDKLRDFYCNSFLFDGRNIIRDDAVNFDYSDEEVLAQIKNGEAVAISQASIYQCSPQKIIKYISRYNFTVHNPDKTLLNLNIYPAYFSGLCSRARMQEPLKKAEACHVKSYFDSIKQPSLIPMMRSFAGSMMAWKNNNFKLVTNEVVKERLAICNDCEFYTSNENLMNPTGLGRCRKCGCFTRFKTKLSTESCPIGKW